MYYRVLSVHLYRELSKFSTVQDQQTFNYVTINFPKVVKIALRPGQGKMNNPGIWCQQKDFRRQKADGSTTKEILSKSKRHSTMQSRAGKRFAERFIEKAAWRRRLSPKQLCMYTAAEAGLREDELLLNIAWRKWKGRTKEKWDRQNVNVPMLGSQNCTFCIYLQTFSWYLVRLLFIRSL